MSTAPEASAEGRAAGPRAALRQRLRALREALAAGPGHAQAHEALAAHLSGVLAALGPSALGLYWPLRAEFNAPLACLADSGLSDVVFALPRARRIPQEMTFHAWDRLPPTSADEHGIPCAAGVPLVPDVVVVPCLGYTDQGHRLGYGGGYYDRWLAAHPHVTAIGVAWSATRVDVAEFGPQPHDVPLMAVVTEAGVVG